jgi:hypothetical protein
MFSQFKSLGNNILCLKYFHINVSFQALTRNKRNIAQGNGHVKLDKIEADKLVLSDSVYVKFDVSSCYDSCGSRVTLYGSRVTGRPCQCYNVIEALLCHYFCFFVVSVM